MTRKLVLELAPNSLLRNRIEKKLQEIKNGKN